MRSAHNRHLQRLTGAFRKKRSAELHPVSYLEMVQRLDCDPIEATIRARRLIFAGKLLRLGDERLPKIMLCGEIIDEEAKKHSRISSYRSCLTDDMKKFDIDRKSWFKLAQDKKEWRKAVEAGRAHFTRS